FDLPTEAEWEYACRAGSKTAFSFGDSLSSKQANFRGTEPYKAKEGPDLKRTARVGSYEPNGFGLYDMHGNVWEWCKDYYETDWYDKSPLKDPKGPKTGSSHVLRGGGWDWTGWACRSAMRGD